MKTEKITIKGKKYNVKYTLRALFIFEQITKKTFKIETLLDNYVFFFFMILANNKDSVLSWDDFIDAMDNDNSLIEKMNKVLSLQKEQDDVFDGGEEEQGSEQKKS